MAIIASNWRQTSTSANSNHVPTRIAQYTKLYHWCFPAGAAGAAAALNGLPGLSPRLSIELAIATAQWRQALDGCLRLSGTAPAAGAAGSLAEAAIAAARSAPSSADGGAGPAAAAGPDGTAGARLRLNASRCAAVPLSIRVPLHCRESSPGSRATTHCHACNTPARCSSYMSLKSLSSNCSRAGPHLSPPVAAQRSARRMPHNTNTVTET